MKKILIIATAILIFILVMIAALSSLLKRGGNTVQTNTPTPTTAPFNATGGIASPTKMPETGAISLDEGLLDAARSLSPYETDTFKFEFSEVNNSIVVTEKTAQGKADYEKWISEEMGLPELAVENANVIFQSASATGKDNDPANKKGYDGLVNFMNLFFKFGEEAAQPGNPTPTSPPQRSENNNNGNSSSSSNVSSNNPGRTNFKYTYYAQCNGYGNIPLPGGCNLCDAGCGPTTVAMIAASYLGDEYNPKTIVNLYENKGYYLSCAGSRYSDAKSALESLGLKTTSYLTYDYEKSDAVATDFKKYLDAGWTIFTLANYCDKGCGHYFWVTEVKNGEILAYDPYYGKSSTPPYNENARYPFPKYRVAFGVKK